MELKGIIEKELNGIIEVDNKPILVGLTGGTASGKTSLCKLISERFENEIAIVSFDSFYKGLCEEDHEDAENYDFDHPNALDFDEAFNVLKTLMSGCDAEIPCYDFATHRRTSETVVVKHAPIIIFEGLYGIYYEKFR